MLANEFFLCFRAGLEGLNHFEEFLVFNLELEDLFIEFLYLLVLFPVAGKSAGGKQDREDENDVETQ